MKRYLFSLCFLCLPLLAIAEDNALPENGYVGVNEDDPIYHLDVNGFASFSSSAKLGNTLPYVGGSRAYRYTFEGNGYNLLMRGSDWHSILGVDRTDFDENGNPESVSNGDRLWELRVSASGANGNNPQLFPFQVIVDGTPSGDNVDQLLRIYGNNLTVKSSGSVGIGTSSLGTSKLKIANSSSDFADYRFVGTGMGQLEFVGWPRGWNINSKTNGKHLYINRDAGANSNVIIGRKEGREFFVRGSDGFVGIGTGTPANRLDVNGTIRSKEIIVETTGWSDFVFEDGYELRPLAEVSTFISKHGHLPDVPSAETIQNEGLSVGESQSIMIQKIEELTLYALQQKDEIQTYKANQTELLKMIRILQSEVESFK